MINYDVPTKLSRNSNISFNVLDEEIMRLLGFTDYKKDTWYRVKMLNKLISFNISINKETKEGKIDILYDDFCQPYDYQYILKNNPEHEYALKIHNEVQNIMKELCINGIVLGYKQNDYI